METEAVRARFEARVEKTPGCWSWTGGKLPDGRGTFSIANRNHTAPRVAWLLHTGELPPPALYVCHRCDNPNCVNPAHLFLGTQSDNVRDMDAKGRRTPKGSLPRIGPRYRPRKGLAQAGLAVWRSLARRGVSWQRVSAAAEPATAAAEFGITRAAAKRLVAYARTR